MKPNQENVEKLTKALADVPAQMSTGAQKLGEQMSSMVTAFANIRR